MLRILPCLALLLAAISATAQPADRPVIVRWFGQSFVQIETPGGKKIVFDPHAIPAFGRPVVQADVLLISHEHNDHNQPEVLDGKPARIFRGLKPAKGRSAEWNEIDEKVGQISIKSVGTFHDGEGGMARGKNTCFIVETDGLRFVHLGDLGHELTEEQVKRIGAVDVLFIPIGGVYTINGDQAKRVIAQLKPRLYVVPIHYGVAGYDDLVGPEEFLDGLDNVKKMPNTNELAIPPDLQLEAPIVAMLHWQKAGGLVPGP